MKKIRRSRDIDTMFRPRICPKCGHIEIHPNTLKIIELAVQGLGQKEIAERLGYSDTGTVSHIFRNIYTALDLQNRNMASLTTWYYTFYKPNQDKKPII